VPWLRSKLEIANLILRQCDLGPIFRTFFPGKFWGKFREKFSPKNVGKKWNFLQKKLRKIIFYKKFHGIFRGKGFSAEKNVRKIGPRLREI
jgi:hypothetical protein